MNLEVGQVWESRNTTLMKYFVVEGIDRARADTMITIRFIYQNTNGLQLEHTQNHILSDHPIFNNGMWRVTPDPNTTKLIRMLFI